MPARGESFLLATVSIPFERMGSEALNVVERIAIRKEAHDAVNSGSHLYLASELVDRTNVARYLKKNGSCARNQGTGQVLRRRRCAARGRFHRTTRRDYSLVRRQRRRQIHADPGLSGAHEPSSGEVLLFGQVVRFSGPHDALQHGIASVYQDLALAPTLSIWQNIFMSAELTRRCCSASELSTRRRSRGIRRGRWDRPCCQAKSSSGRRPCIELPERLPVTELTRPPSNVCAAPGPSG
jgi:hypothetical protein